MTHFILNRRCGCRWHWRSKTAWLRRYWASENKRTNSWHNSVVLQSTMAREHCSKGCKRQWTLGEYLVHSFNTVSILSLTFKSVLFIGFNRCSSIWFAKPWRFCHFTPWSNVIVLTPSFYPLFHVSLLTLALFDAQADIAALAEEVFLLWRRPHRNILIKSLETHLWGVGHKNCEKAGQLDIKSSSSCKSTVNCESRRFILLSPLRWNPCKKFSRIRPCLKT